jgi:hypothetical protein
VLESSFFTAYNVSGLSVIGLRLESKGWPEASWGALHQIEWGVMNAQRVKSIQTGAPERRPDGREGRVFLDLADRP